MEHKVIAPVLALAAAAAFVYADTGDSYYIQFGPVSREAREFAANNPEDWKDRAPGFENPDIAMTAEEVVLTLHSEYAEVEATFDFLNTAAEAREVEMCFPVSYGMLGMDQYGARFEEESTVAGKKAGLDVTLDGEPAPYQLTEGKGVLEVPAFAVWPVRFEGGARRRVVCRYQDKYSGGGMELDRSVEYIFSTGASWKGPIGKGRMIAKPGDDFDWSIPLYYVASGLPPARDDGGAVVWEFENLEPLYEVPRDHPWETCTYMERASGLAAVHIGFLKREVVERGYIYSNYRVVEGPGVPAGTMVNGLNFRTAPDPLAPHVEGKPTFALDEPMRVLERKGEWYRVLDNDNREGWVRWRYVDPDTGRETIYVEMCVSCA